MITLFHLPSTGSIRSIWLACELGLTFQINRRDESDDPELSNSHPLSKAPMLLDDNISIATHGAAREYLLSKYDRTGMRPPMAHPDYIHYLQWVHYLEGTLLPLVDQQRIIHKLGQSRVPFFARSIMKKTVLNYINTQIEPEILRQLNYIDESLGTNGWTCGEQFCAADIDLAYILLGLEADGKLQPQHKNIANFLEAIKERPAYQFAQEKSSTKPAALDYEAAKTAEEAAVPASDETPTVDDNNNQGETESPTAANAESTSETVAEDLPQEAETNNTNKPTTQP